MTRNWAPLIKDIQEAIRTVILAERTAQSTSLPAGLQGTDFNVSVAVDMDQPAEKPYSVRILPPENTKWRPNVTNSFEADPMEFRLGIEIQTAAASNKAILMREVVGLIVDALSVDTTLGGLTGGILDIDARELMNGPGVLAQEVIVRLQSRA